MVGKSHTKKLRKIHINIFHKSVPLIFCHRPHWGQRMFLSIFCLLSIMLIFVFLGVKVLPSSIAGSQDPNILINNNSGDHPDHGIKTEVVSWSSFLIVSSCLRASLFESFTVQCYFRKFSVLSNKLRLSLAEPAKNMRIVAEILLQTLPLYVFLTNSTFQVKHAAVENF